MGLTAQEWFDILFGSSLLAVLTYIGSHPWERK